MGTAGDLVCVVYRHILCIYHLPRKKQDKKHQDMVSSLKRGEKVVTIGGMKGEIAKVKENTVMLRVSDGVEIEMLKKAIAYKDGEE